MTVACRNFDPSCSVVIGGWSKCDGSGGGDVEQAGVVEKGDSVCFDVGSCYGDRFSNADDCRNLIGEIGKEGFVVYWRYINDDVVAGV